MAAVIYHNPRCSKSRQTLALLTERGIEPEIINYLETPPNQAALKKILRLLDKPATDLIRFKETAAKAQNLSASDPRSEDEWLDAITSEPILLERPIVIIDDTRAAVGRPPENVLALLDGH